MAKDREGKFHPGKGKPSGINKEEGLGIQHTEPGKLEEYNELTDKYTDGEDELSALVPLKNPNRNTNKGRPTGSGRTGPLENATSPRQEIEKDDAGFALPEQLPGLLSRQRFSDLATYHSECCITIYLEKPDGVGDNLTRFKNQLAELEKIMMERDMKHEDREDLLGYAKSLVKNADFWRQHQADQLAFFISKEVFQYMVMAVSTTPERIFETSFYVTPLLPLIRRENYFYINVISKKGCRLYKADQAGIQPVPVEIPQEVADVKAVPEKDDAAFRSMGTGNLTKGNLHGTDNKADDKVLTASFFEAIDDVFWKEVLHGETVPMVIAGVEYVIPIYRSVSDYKFIWPEYLTGNREQQDVQVLYREAMELMKPYFEEKKNKALEEYGHKSARVTTSSLAAEIIPASYYARIAVLFVRKGEHIWGRFDMDHNTLELAHTPDEGGEDLVDNAVTQTIVNGGEVFLLNKAEMPADSQMAALFRY